MLVKAIVVSLLSLASGQLLAAQCSADVESTDQMTFGDTKAIDISKTCKTFTVNLTHSGSLPKNIMGHNWILSTAADAPGIASDGMTAGLDKDYLKPDDSRIIAHTKMIGAGEKSSVTFDVSKLSEGGNYQFFCSFPGHISMMKGTVSLVD